MTAQTFSTQPLKTAEKKTDQLEKEREMERAQEEAAAERESNGGYQ